jgi:hypothetical protein
MDFFAKFIALEGTLLEANPAKEGHGQAEGRGFGRYIKRVHLERFGPDGLCTRFIADVGISPLLGVRYDLEEHACSYRPHMCMHT